MMTKRDGHELYALTVAGEVATMYGMASADVEEAVRKEMLRYDKKHMSETRLGIRVIPDDPRGYYILDPLGDGNQWCATKAGLKEALKYATPKARVVTWSDRHAG